MYFANFENALKPRTSLSAYAPLGYDNKVQLKIQQSALETHSLSLSLSLIPSGLLYIVYGRVSTYTQSFVYICALTTIYTHAQSQCENCTNMCGSPNCSGSQCFLYAATRTYTFAPSPQHCARVLDASSSFVVAQFSTFTTAYCYIHIGAVSGLFQQKHERLNFPLIDVQQLTYAVLIRGLPRWPR